MKIGGNNMSKTSIFVGVVLGVLVLAVGAQSYLLYGMQKKLEKLNSQTANVEKSVVVASETESSATTSQEKEKERIVSAAQTPNHASRHHPSIQFMWNEPDFDSWNPWQEMAAFEQRMNEMQKRMRTAFDANFGSQGSDFSQIKIQLQDKKDYFEVDVTGEGLDVSSVNVTLDDQRYLKISGIKTEQIEERDDSGATTHKSISQRFVQALMLPAPVQVDKMQVQQEKSGLKIILPKQG
ncbi:MAG: Hsp20/alpha crystallin family protein [Verrucomicrobiota bacterium]